MGKVSKFQAIFDARRELEAESSDELVNQSTSQPVNQPDDQLTTTVNQSTSPDSQLTTPPPATPSPSLVNQSTSQPAERNAESFYPSRVRRKLKGIRLPADKLERYEDWQHANRRRFPDFQTAVEYAMDWLTSQPVDQLTSQPVNQSTTLITNDLNNLVINDEKAKKALAKYSQVVGRPATAKDLEAYREVAALPIEAIEQGIEETKRRADQAGRPFNGFRYALNVIRDMSKSVPQQVEPVEPKLCDLCRELNGFVQVYEGDRKVGVKKCPNH
jgi:hypothetical protein